uniref:Uncharacterized protein n=1 Tax=Steinernema glaseri TaxID=37863 RepID=A0A1I8AM05_9BILA
MTRAVEGRHHSKKNGRFLEEGTSLRKTPTVDISGRLHRSRRNSATETDGDRGSVCTRPPGGDGDGSVCLYKASLCLRRGHFALFELEAASLSGKDYANLRSSILSAGWTQKVANVANDVKLSARLLILCPDKGMPWELRSHTYLKWSLSDLTKNQRKYCMIALGRYLHL